MSRSFFLDEIMPAVRDGCVLSGNLEGLLPESLTILREYAFAKVVGDRYAAIQPMTFGKFRLKLGPVARLNRRDYWDDVEYCYENVTAALEALNAWDGVTEPSGWFRCPTDARRRPDGDPSREYVRA